MQRTNRNLQAVRCILIETDPDMTCNASACMDSIVLHTGYADVSSASTISQVIGSTDTIAQDSVRELA